MKVDDKKRNRYIKDLKENCLLKDLDQEEINILLKEISEESWPKNTCLIDREKVRRRFHFIIEGRLKIYKLDPLTGREFTLFLLSRNDVFDVLSLLDDYEHDVFYESLDRVTILTVPLEIMRKWIEIYPVINKNLLPYLAVKMRQVEEYAAGIILTDIPTRLAKLILSNINSTSHKLELINDLSDEELAHLIGSTRAVVNRHLQEFKKDGTLNVGRKKLEIRDLELLLRKIEKKE